MPVTRIDLPLENLTQAVSEEELQRKIAESLGVKVGDYASIAFSANTMPVFGYSCAVFMQSDIGGFHPLAFP